MAITLVLSLVLSAGLEFFSIGTDVPIPTTGAVTTLDDGTGPPPPPPPPPGPKGQG